MRPRHRFTSRLWRGRGSSSIIYSYFYYILSLGSLSFFHKERKAPGAHFHASMLMGHTLPQSFSFSVISPLSQTSFFFSSIQNYNYSCTQGCVCGYFLGETHRRWSKSVNKQIKSNSDDAALRKKKVYTKKILFDWSKPFIGHRTNGIYVCFKEMNALKARKYFFPNKKIFLKS